MSVDERERERREPLDPHAEAWSLLADALEPRAPELALRERLLARLRGAERWAPFAAEVARAFGIELLAMREALSRIHDPQAWQPGLIPGSLLLITPELRQAQTAIVRLSSGTRIAKHRHVGRELTYVLDGVLGEDDARSHRAGALLDMAPGTEHDVSVPDGHECLVVFAVMRP